MRARYFYNFVWNISEIAFVWIELLHVGRGMEEGTDRQTEMTKLT